MEYVETGRTDGSTPLPVTVGHMLQARVAFAAPAEPVPDATAATLVAGEHRVRAWLARHKAVQVHFGDERPFYNVNTLDDLHTDTPRAP